VRKKTFPKSKFIITFACSSSLLLDDSYVSITRQLWWTKKEFSSVDVIQQRFLMLTYHGGWKMDRFEAAFQRRCLTISIWSYIYIYIYITTLNRNVTIEIYKVLTMPVISCGCYTCFLTLNEEHRLRTALKWILEPKWDAAWGKCTVSRPIIRSWWQN
jgi:hypothetical protein